jgi:LCP family protein required for cell wall assembly
MIEEPKDHQETIDLSGIYSENRLNPPKKSTNNKFWLKLGIFVIFIVGLSSFALTSKTITGEGVLTGKGFSWLSNFSVVGQLSQLAKSSEQKLKGEERGRINILLTGIGGSNHDGGQLADTIMLLSLDPVSKKVGMVSVPRDLTVPIEGYGYRKINSINALAESDKPGSGGIAFAQAFSQIFNQPIDYYVRVDFSGFSKFIDDIGGIDVNVEHQLDDYAYPILGQEDNPNYYSRYEHLHVETGLQHMDGDLALKFARSRHGINGEGSDFARARRQQLVIEAVKNKLKGTSLLLNPSLITKAITNYQEHVSTNLQVWEIAKFWGLFKDVSKEQMVNKVLDDAPDNLLKSGRGLEGAYILTPKAGDFSEIQYMMANLLSAPSAEVKNQLEAEQPKLMVLNGTWVNGLATKASTDLEGYGFKIVSTSNANQKDYQYSVIYDLSGGVKPQSLTLLQAKTNANILTNSPDWLAAKLKSEASYNANFEQPDFVLVLGQTADSKKAGTKNVAE